jgi:hypothetical protein
MAPTNFETAPFDVGVSATGTLDAATFETIPIGGDVPARLIHASQEWGANISWVMNGPLLPLFKSVIQFSATLYLEDLTPAEQDFQYSLSVAASSGVISGINQLTYADQKIVVPALDVPVGTYKPTVVVQAFLTNGNPLPIAGFVELPQVLIYQEV